MSMRRGRNVRQPVARSDRPGYLTDTYGVRLLPTTLFTDGDRKLNAVIYGEIEGEKELRESAGKLVK